MRTIACICLLWASTYPLLQAQYHQTYLYTIADGLPMTECERVTVDRKGYLWVGSTAGHVSRFNGRTFENMGVKGMIGAVAGGAKVDKYGVWYFNQKGDKAAGTTKMTGRSIKSPLLWMSSSTAPGRLQAY